MNWTKATSTADDRPLSIPANDWCHIISGRCCVHTSRALVWKDTDEKNAILLSMALLKASTRWWSH